MAQDQPLVGKATPQDNVISVASSNGSKQATEAPTPDPNLVDWDGPNDPNDPLNWPRSRKWATLLPMSLFNFLSSVSSATMAPALQAINQDLKFHSPALLVLSLSIFLLGTAFVPLFTAPLSEVLGRSMVLQSANIFYILFNTLCGAAKTPNQLIAFRFLAGLGGAGPFAIGSGINADLFRPRERGQAIAVYTLAPLIGVVAGPIAGGFLVQYTSWRWCFYVISIAGGAVQILGIPFFHETYAPVLLKKKCRKLRKSTRNGNLYTQHNRTSLLQLLQTSIARPFILLGTQPIVQVWSLYCAYLWGTLYLLIATFPDVWTNIYGESVSIGSLNYLSFFVGMGMASQVGTRLADRYYRVKSVNNGGQGTPEFRLPVLILGSILVPVGLFWYGWSARPSMHWIMPNIGAAIYGGGAVLEMLCVIGYVIDTYTKYAASAMAAIIVLRSILAAFLPIAAPVLYHHLGWGWSNTLLALIAVVIGIPAPLLLWHYGHSLRKASPYARDDL
ncbi:hypothetical protein DV736_g1195, partial [Chaetothyriales sp. CBS 134916]